MLCVLLRFVLNRTGILTLDRGGGQALLMIVLSATVVSALAGLAPVGSNGRSHPRVRGAQDGTKDSS